MATESWVLDGVALSSGNFNILELTADPPKARREWLTAADSESAALARQSLHENRTITMKLRIAPQASMNAALDQIGVILDKFRAASATNTGVALVWTPANSTRSVTFDVLAGEILELPIGLDGHARSWFMERPIFTVELTCKPYWRGTETLTSTASSSTPIVTLEVAGVTGDVPALGRLIVTDTATQARRHIEWGMEGQYYNSGTSLLLESDNFVTSGFAGAQAVGITGAYDVGGGNTVVAAVTYTAPVAVAGTGNLSHVGSFRVKARVYSSSVGTGVRIGYQVGDSPYTYNEWATTISDTTWCELDLGVIHISPVTLGTQRWKGQIEAFSTLDARDFQIDYLVFVPVDGYGKSRAAYALSPGVATGIDKFTSTTAGNALNGRVAPLGGTWATSGSATDFLFYDLPGSTAESLTRTALSDTSFGRIALLSATTYIDTEVSTQLNVSNQTGLGSDIQVGVVARYVNSTNMLRAYLWWNSTLSRWELHVTLVSAGVTVADRRVLTPTISVGNWYRVTCVVYASGWHYAAVSDPAGAVIAWVANSDSRLATAGSHATGARGINDFWAGGAAMARYYDDFYAATPGPEPIVVNSGRSLQFRHDAQIRLDTTSTYYGAPPTYNGSRFLVPTGTSRVMVKAKRNDVEAVPDLNVTDATQVQVGWTPRGLAVPR